jgi:hypothetical protein
VFSTAFSWTLPYPPTVSKQVRVVPFARGGATLAYVTRDDLADAIARVTEASHEDIEDSHRVPGHWRVIGDHGHTFAMTTPEEMLLA